MATPRKRTTKSATARGAAVTRQNTGSAPETTDTPETAGGTPVGALGVSREEQATQNRLAAQREAKEEREAGERTDEAAERALPAGQAQAEVYTVVVKNGLSHRRNGVIFGGDPTTVDVSKWTYEQKQRFFNDQLLMIVPGTPVNARGAGLSAARSFPARMTGGSGENATPEMLAALSRGQAMSHPASGPGSPVVGTTSPQGMRELERALGGGDGNEEIEE